MAETPTPLDTKVLDEENIKAGVIAPSPVGLPPLRRIIYLLGSKSYLVVILALVMLVGTVKSPYFLTGQNITNILVTGSVVSVIAIGQFFVIVTGGIDLSVGSTAALSSVVVALALGAGYPIELAVVLALGVAAFTGLVNGILVVYARITPFIVTLATLSVIQGIAYVIQTGNQITIADNTFLNVFSGSLGPIPTPVIIPFVVMLVGVFVMASTRLGRGLYALGGNAEAARLSGLPIQRYLLTAYLVSGFLAGIGGLLIAAQLTEGSAIVGQDYNLDSIAAAVVGGTSLFGGTGDPISAVIGGLVIGTILNIMDILSLQAEAQLIVRGIVILLAVFFTSGIGTKLIPKLVRMIRPPARPALDAGVPTSSRQAVGSSDEVRRD